MSTCDWPGNDPLMQQYHDKEWGTPLHDDRKHFEFLILDGFQAGLSWKTILYKRENFRKAFDNFDVEKVAKYSDKKLDELLQDKGIIRNRLKVYSARTNAQSFLKVVDEFGSFDKYIWQFTGGTTLHHQCASNSDIPATSPESDAMSKDLKKRGFKFVGSTICYAYMQAAGMINDHLLKCKRYEELRKG